MRMRIARSVRQISVVIHQYCHVLCVPAKTTRTIMRCCDPLVHMPVFRTSQYSHVRFLSDAPYLSDRFNSVSTHFLSSES